MISELVKIKDAFLGLQLFSELLIHSFCLLFHSFCLLLVILLAKKRRMILLCFLALNYVLEEWPIASRMLSIMFHFLFFIIHPGNFPLLLSLSSKYDDHLNPLYYLVNSVVLSMFYHTDIFAERKMHLHMKTDTVYFTDVISYCPWCSCYCPKQLTLSYWTLFKGTHVIIMF